ncbi:MAG: nicotinate (nicotinamide) nucleotide adenylyltransferase [Planctomycetales bacterium]|nr:nicotinate (nicotinamide) nucleotide adenylyltransferase [Planctomycetales bacterium]
MSESTARHRVGIFGGTFDPLHVGHLLLAEQAWEALDLREVRFIPAALAPHKQHLQAAEAKHRWEMLQLALGGNPHFIADDRELRRGGTSYTIETLQELERDLPQADLVLLLGADSLAELHTWRSPEEICQRAFVAILARGGQPPPDLQQLARYLPADQLPDLESHRLPMPQIEISSSDIRQRIAAGKSVRYQLHPAVAAYIETHKLYAGE